METSSKTTVLFSLPDDPSIIRLEQAPAASFTALLNNKQLIDRAQGAVVIILEGYDQGLAKAIAEYVPNFPTALFKKVIFSNATVLPFRSRRREHGISWACNLLSGSIPDMDSGAEQEQNDHHLRCASTDTSPWPYSTRVGTWVSNSASIAGRSGPLVVLLFKADHGNPNLIDGIATHFSQDNNRRLSRLSGVPLFIGVDLHTLFSEYSAIVRSISKDYTMAERETDTRALLVVSRVQALHKRARKIMQIRNALTTNISLIGKLLALADGDNINDVEDDGNGEHEDLSASVEGSLRDWMSLLDGHNDDLLEYSNALQALIQMEFNITAARTNLSITVLTVVAFIFAPLSFFSSILSQNGGYEMELRWFATACIVILVVGIGCVVILDPLIRWIEASQTGSKGARHWKLTSFTLQKRSHSAAPRPPDDIEGIIPDKAPLGLMLTKTRKWLRGLRSPSYPLPSGRSNSATPTIESGYRIGNYLNEPTPMSAWYRNTRDNNEENVLG